MIEADQIVTFAKKYWKGGVCALLLCAALTLWVERLVVGHRTQALCDFTQLKSLFAQAETPSLEQTEKAYQILTRHPELAPSYDTRLAIAFLNQQQTHLGEKLFRKHYAKVHEHLPAAYQSYCRGSLALMEQKWDEAYQCALSFEENAQRAPQWLRACNLLRLCALAQKLGHKAPLEQLTTLPNFAALQEVLNQGEASLTRYIGTSSTYLESTDAAANS